MAGKPWFSWHWCIGGFFLRPLHAVRFHVLLKDQIRWQYFVSHVRVWKGVADGSRPCSAWSSTAASTTIWWKWHGCRFRRFVIPWQGVFFFHPRIWGPEPSSGRPGRQLSVCRGHRKRFLQWPWFWVFKVKIWMAVVNNNLQKRRCVSQPKMLHVHAFSLSGNISQGCHTWWQKLRPMFPCFPRQAFCSSRLSLPLGRTGGYEIWCSEWNKHHRAIILSSLSLYIYI